MIEDVLTVMWKEWRSLLGARERRLQSLGGPLLMLAFFCSGLNSIGYELIWMRSIVFKLGCFTYVFSAVLTIYLIGNVIGAWIGSRGTVSAILPLFPLARNPCLWLTSRDPKPVLAPTAWLPP